MKTLYLLRHGHAESKIKQPDIARNLDKEGQMEVQVSAEKLLQTQHRPGLIISSPANRAFQTAEIAASVFGIHAKNIEIVDTIYGHDAETLLETIESQDETCHSIMLTGHNPAISELVMMLCPEVHDQLHTAGIACIEIHASSWQDLAKREKKLIQIINP